MLKIIKHCQDEGSAGELVLGVLLGLIQNHKLEITNCFALPSVRVGEDDDEDDGENLITCEKIHVCIENQEQIQKILKTGAEFLRVAFTDIIFFLLKNF